MPPAHRPKEKDQMATMKALVAHAVGEPVEVLRLEERPVPEPGRGQVRIRVQAAPVNLNDLHIMRGRYGFAPELPVVLGQESVGVIDALGDGVDGLAPGQRVISVGIMGTWQEYLLADAARVLPVPDGLSTSTAAQLLTNPLTALLLVTRELGMQPGEWLLQTAAGSTVGRLVMQLAHHVGFKTINVVRRRPAVAELRRLGGTEVICTEDEDLPQRVAQIVGEEGVRKAIDSVAGPVGAAVARSLAPGGELIVYGALSTHRQTDPAKLTIPLSAPSMIYGTHTVRGFWLYRWFSTMPPEQVGAAIAKTLQLVADGTMRIPEAHPMKLSQFADAMRLAEAPAHGGKPLLVPAG
jgi:NADPH:quinone reductase-like Zn-dependent oxidoreductase